MADTPTTKYPTSKENEKIQVNKLETILMQNGGVLTKFWSKDDSFPDVDGRLELLNADRTKTGKILEAQIKSVNYTRKDNIPYTQCNQSFLAVCQNSNTPILLIGVDPDNYVAYWEYMNPQNIEKLLIEKQKVKNPVIHFHKNKLIKQSETKYLKSWKQICDYHANKINEELVLNLVRHQNKNFCSANYDEIIEKLNMLKDLVLFKSGNNYPVADFIVSLGFNILKNQCGYQATTKTKFGELPGKSLEDLKETYLEILNNYDLKFFIKTKEIFDLLILFSHDESDKIKKSALDSLQRIVKYDPQILNIVGYSKQREILDYILEWDEKNRIKNLDAVLSVTQKLFETNYEGVKFTYPKMHITRGDLQPTDYLIKIRKDSVQLLQELYLKIDNIEDKIKILNSLRSASTHFPEYNPEHIEEINNMITNDVQDLVKFYDKLIDTEDVAILHNIADQLAWFYKRHKDKVTEIKSIADKLSQNKFYNLYSFLVYKDYDLISERPEASKGIDKLIQQINQNNHADWLDKIKKIAQTKKVKDMWEFTRFREFLQKIGQSKIELAKIILTEFLSNSIPIEFSTDILSGLRQAKQQEILNWYTQDAIKKQKCYLIPAIIQSTIEIPKEDIDNNDFELLLKMSEQELNEELKFIEGCSNNIKERINNALLNALLWLEQKNPDKVKTAIKNLFEKNQKSINFYIQTLLMADHRDWIKLANWPLADLNFIIDKMVKQNSLGYDSQQVLLEFGKKDYQALIEFFIKRINHANQKDRRDLIKHDNYEPIPFHFHNFLTDFISQHNDYIPVISKHISQMKKDGGLYNWHLSHFIQRIGGKDIKQIVLSLAQKGDAENIDKALDIARAQEWGDIEICFEIIKSIKDDLVNDKKRTEFENEDITIMGSADVVSGISNSYIQKLEQVKKYETKGNVKLEAFKNKVIKYFEKSIKYWQKHENEEIEEMKKEYGD